MKLGARSKGVSTSRIAVILAAANIRMKLALVAFSYSDDISHFSKQRIYTINITFRVEHHVLNNEIENCSTLERFEYLCTQNCEIAIFGSQ